MKKLFTLLAISFVTLLANAQCHAGFTFTINGATVAFSNTSTYTATANYHWDLGDGTWDYSTTPANYTYQYAGTYTVCLTLNDTLPSTCTNTFCDVVSITNAPHPPCNASFWAGVDSVAVSSTVHFYNSSTYNVKYIWSYGDGSHDTTTSNYISHQFPAYSTYSVCLTAITNVGDTCHSCSMVNSTPCMVQLSDSFSKSVLHNTATFTTICSGAAHPFYNWNFGDGQSSTAQNPAHSYQYNGTYTVCLTYYDSGGCSKTHCDTLNITVASLYPCTAMFSYRTDSMGTGNISFQDISTMNIVSSTWSFPGGNPATATGSYVQVSYPTGTYTVTLNVTNQSGISCSYSNVVHVGSYCNTVSASFNMQPTNTPHAWTVNNTSNGMPPVSYTWHWGDGATSTGVAPNHTYASAGWYTICLDLIDANGCGSSFCSHDTLYKYDPNSSMISMQVIDHTTTGVNTISLADAEVSVFPNPSSGKFTVYNTNMPIKTAEVYNSLGKLVHTQAMHNKTELDLSAYPKGVYWLKLNTGENSITRKLVLIN